MAYWQLRASPFGTGRGGPGRRWRWEEQGREQQQSPITFVSVDQRNRIAKPYQSRVADQFTGQPEERLLKVVVRLCRNIIILQILLPVEGDGFGLDFSFLDIYLIARENYGNVLADTDQITYSRRVSKCDRTTSGTSETYGAS